MFVSLHLFLLFWQLLKRLLSLLYFFRTSSKAAAPNDTREVATATLLVVSLPLISIIFAFPALSVWVSTFSEAKKIELFQAVVLVVEKFDTKRL